MKRMLLKLMLLLGIMLYLFEIPLYVSADELSLTEAAPEQETELDLSDGDALAEGYINEQFGGIASAAIPKLKARRVTQGSKLAGPNLAAYQLILEEVRAIAAGKRTSTELQLTRSELGIAEKYYYASDLSLANVLGTDGKPTDDAKAAMNQIIGFDIKAVMNALMSDYPYEFYWFDKTTGYVHSSCSYGTNTKTGNSFICFPENYYIRMSVASAYAYQSQRYVTDPEETGRATSAAASARSIVEACAAMGDVEKLTAYKDTICELTSYDRTASGSETYGDPWQMVYVFDGDADTNVVCEGYSKAFQYLCDNSDFTDSSITCNTVTGKIQGVVSNGLHMWNLVSIGGENFHADITNSDTGTAGSRGQLFLAGVPAENLTWQDAENSILYKYSFTSPKLTYEYDTDTLSLFSQDELQIADHAYQTIEEVCVHEWDLENPVIKEPTCEEAGIRTYTCQKDSSHTYTVVILATGHDLVKTEAKAATCEAAGNTAYFTCRNCGEVFADAEGKTKIQLSDTELQVLGHDWIEPVWGEWKEAEGIWRIDISFPCSRCNEEQTPEVTVKKTKDVPATADESGETVYTATVVFDGETYTNTKTITTLPTGHNFSDEPTWTWTKSDDSYTAAAVFKCTDEGCDKEMSLDADVTVKEKADPTCETAGSITYEATVTFDEKTYTDVKVVDVEALGHDWDEGTITTEPNCTEPGVRTFTCKHDSTHTRTEPVSAAGHQMTKTEAKKATCEEAGNIEYYTCSVCKKLFSDGAGTQEISSIEKTVVEALGHDWDEGKITTEPTCTEEGVRTYTCKHDSTHTRTEPVPAAGHTMTRTAAVAATCEEAGNIEYYTCSVCGKLFEDADGTKEISSIEKIVVEALGHDWDEGVVTTEPTDTTPGVRTYTCKHDPSHHKTEEIITDAYKQYQADKTEADKVAAELTAIADTIAAAENLSSLTGTNAASVTAVRSAYASYNKLSAAQKAILQETQPNLVAQLETANAKITELEKQQEAAEDTKKQQEEAAKKQAEAAARAAEQAKQEALAKEAAAEEAAGHKTVAAVDKAITSMKSDANPSGSGYGTLSARVTKTKKNALKVQWNKVSGAAGYIVYANKCGKSNQYVKIAELGSGSATSYNLTKINSNKLSKNTYYKILVAAYKNSSTGKRVIATAKTIHVATSGGKNGNPTKLTVNKKKVSVKVKKKFKLTVKQTGKSGTKIKKHRAVMFESSDPKIATVTKKGVIKGIKKGKCYIYVYAQNGLSKKVKVTVR
ncbi:MAG: Ig-like domain-containing protein [Eubacterium sp.]|nr:Ig-like domain-containing protein [Eubacterium sp.]